MRPTRLLFFIFICALFTISCSRAGSEMTDLVLVNGSVWTLNPSQPWAEAVAVGGEKIMRVGSTAEIRKMAGEKTEVMDLKGGLVLPGFIDSHTHFLAGGFSLASVQLRDVTSREQFARRVGEKAREMGKGEWILGGNWDHEQFSPPELPSKEWIDAVSPDNPVLVSRYDGHMALANSLALRLGGIEKSTPPPAGGEILKDSKSGQPTGILKDAAMDLVSAKMAEPSLKAKMEAAEAALHHAAQFGVTSLTEMADPTSFEVYQELLKLGKLSSRIYVFIQIDDLDLYERLKLKTPFGNNFLKIGGLKGFADGSLGSATAYFFEPYTDDPKASGLLAAQMFPEGIMEKRILRADKAGLQVAIHAIGDKANFIILNILEEAIARNGPRDRRWRIEHAQHLRPAEIERFGKLGVIASMQPYHAIDDGRWAEKKIGTERCRTTYAFKSLLDKGAILAFGSDWTVAPLDPIAGIYAAVTRRTIDGKNPEGWFPEQKISLEDAIKGYTLNGAYAEFSEKTKGSIEEGKLADLVVLDQNLFKIAPDKIKDARVSMTIVGGRIIYKKD